jgi:hypothetical protein
MDNAKSPYKPMGHVELYKCTQIKGSIDNDQCSFQLSAHATDTSVVLRANSIDLRNTWIQIIKQAIEHNGIACSKCCKPKLIVNPMQLNSKASINESLIKTASAPAIGDASNRLQNKVCSVLSLT